MLVLSYESARMNFCSSAIFSFPRDIFHSFLTTMAWTFPRSHEPKYPGVNLPLRHIRLSGLPGEDFYRMGSYQNVLHTQSELLQVREVAMMMLMDRLTDKPNWHEAVFDDAIVAGWRAEVLTQPEDAIYLEIVPVKWLPMPKRTRIMTRTAFDYVS